MTRTAFVGGTVVTPGGPIDATVVVDGPSIASVGEEPRVGDHTIDVSGSIVSPGFVDVQINGGFGIDLVADPSRLWELGERLPQHGVTSFLPTIISSPSAVTDATLAALERPPTSFAGAWPLGAHFEGPMLNPRRRGAHPVHHLRPPSLAEIEDWSRSTGVALVTIAPELGEAKAVIAALAERGVTVAAGHTEATAGQARAGLEAGITAVTHLFNAMAPLGHRQPNLVGLALAEPGLPVGIIADGVHLDPMVVMAIWAAKGPDDVVLVTDAVAPMGRRPGRFAFAGETVVADGRSVRNAAGDLAGSVLTMGQAVRNLVAYTGCAPHEALAAASTNPARMIGEHRRGRIEAGALADLAVLDAQLEVVLTVCSGQIAFTAPGAPVPALAAPAPTQERTTSWRS